MKFVYLMLVLALAMSSNVVCAAVPPTEQECQDALTEKTALLVEMNQKSAHLAETVHNVLLWRGSLRILWGGYWIDVAANNPMAEFTLTIILQYEMQLQVLEGLQVDLTLELNQLQMRLDQLNAILNQC